MPKLPLPRLPGPWGGPLNLPLRNRRSSMMTVRSKTYPKYRAEFADAAGDSMAPFAVLPQKHGPRNDAIPAMQALHQTKMQLEQLSAEARDSAPVGPVFAVAYPSRAGQGDPTRGAGVPEIPFDDEVNGGQDPTLALQEKGRRMKEDPESEYGPGGRRQVTQRLGLERFAALTDAMYWMG